MQQHKRNKWSKKWGDRMNELVFIGQDIQKEKMTAELESCLLQDDEYHLFEKQISFADPFPAQI